MNEIIYLNNGAKYKKKISKTLTTLKTISRLKKIIKKFKSNKKLYAELRKTIRRYENWYQIRLSHLRS